MPCACCGRLITAIGIVCKRACMREAQVRGRQTVDRRTEGREWNAIRNVRFYAGKSDQIANEVNLTAFI